MARKSRKAPSLNAPGAPSVRFRGPAAVLPIVCAGVFSALGLSVRADDPQPAVNAPAPAAEWTCALPARLAESLLEGEAEAGDLPVDAEFQIDEKLLLDEGRTQATVEAKLAAGPLSLKPASLCFFLLLDADGEALLSQQQPLQVADFTTVENLRYVTRVDLPEGTRSMTAIFLDAQSGLWGAAPLEQPAESIAGPSFTAIRLKERENTWIEIARRKKNVAGSTTVADAPATPAPAAPGQPPAPPPAQPPVAKTPGTVLPGHGPRVNFPQVKLPTIPGQRPPVDKTAAAPRVGIDAIVRLVPPREQPVTGGTLFNCLVTSEAVDKVVFTVDGQQVTERKRAPFRARLEMASPAREQTVRAIAYDAQGKVMGEDQIKVNSRDLPFRARIVKVEGDPAKGSVEVEATVSVPAGGRLAKVEIFRNDRLIETFAAPPYKVLVPTVNGSLDDYVRVAATLEDGSFIDDVQMLSGVDIGEEVEVNLAEIRVLVSDKDGRPIADLEQDDFRVTMAGKSQDAQGFALAEDVPLLLGLVVDSSGSMQMLMQDTQRAAAKFLGRTLKRGDQAFLVDFDLQPRLLRPMTPDLRQLLLDLGRLNADGRTAMYDAVVFALLQYEDLPGRRALVILTDGDDLDSRFSPNDSAKMARDAGTLVYVIGLGALDGIPRAFAKGDLKKVSEGTGGRLFLVESFQQLDLAYEVINRELRSQYTLTFYTDGDLTDEQRRSIKVEIKGRKDLEVRTVIGRGRTSG
jgi:Ca-activated chloride channel family protein